MNKEKPSNNVPNTKSKITFTSIAPPRPTALKLGTNASGPRLATGTRSRTSSNNPSTKVDRTGLITYMCGGNKFAFLRTEHIKMLNTQNQITSNGKFQYKLLQAHLIIFTLESWDVELQISTNWRNISASLLYHRSA